ncbi:MAG: hypothetical protein JWN94_4468 [Betaproteobacteria bacterium]|nr:hypothetical protein [Betaproteobacteria bacterium]
MWSSNPAGFARADCDRRPVRSLETSEFDRGARAFAFACAVLYAVLSGGLIVAIVKATLAL